ncbi:MAG: PBSX family phage terminase large subunit [Acidaminococcaceae bacterium]|nr:PBSX family phage terminase large subunit [Acidaminococcaceae bacterium]
MQIEWSAKQAGLIMAPFDHAMDWNEGTPRSGKTTAGTMRFARHLIRSRDALHLVTAYSAEQAYRLIMDGDGMGLLHIFKGHCRVSHDDSGAHLLVKLPDGEKKVYWKGGGKADSHKAITGMSLGSVYFCEINLLHDTMIQECFRRTYAAKDRWHIADLNPPSPADPCIKNVLNVQDCRFIHWTCADNPVLTPERLREIETACKKSPFLYKRDWLGERVIPEGVIYWMFSTEKHILNRLPDDLNIVEAFCAGDGGTTDATSIGFYIAGFFGDRYFGPRDYKLYRVGNWRYDGGQMAMSDQARHIVGEFLPYMRKKYQIRENAIYIDPACKALRLEIEKLGLLTEGADNNAHDVKGGSKGLKVGVEMLQSGINDGRFYLVEDERYGTEPFVKEAGLYCADDKGNPVDAYNHSLDECRYAANHFFKTYGLWG